MNSGSSAWAIAFRRCLSGCNTSLLCLEVLLFSAAPFGAAASLPVNQELEEVISMIRRYSWLSTKISFLEKIHQVFHLWHVVHRPFSYSLVVLVVIHIGTELLLGYF